jgi:hypothetical protein
MHGQGSKAEFMLNHKHAIQQHTPHVLAITSSTVDVTVAEKVCS